MQETIFREILFVAIFFLLPAFILSAFSYLKHEDIFDCLLELDQKEKHALKMQAITHNSKIFLLAIVWCILILDFIPNRYVAIPIIIEGIFQISEGTLTHFNKICYRTFRLYTRYYPHRRYRPPPLTPRLDLPDSDFKITIVPSKNSTYTIQILKFPFVQGIIFWKFVTGILLCTLGIGVFSAVLTNFLLHPY